MAALPKNKAIYNIDRPDMISYSPYISHSAIGDRQSYGEVWIVTMCCMLPQMLALVDRVESWPPLSASLPPDNTPILFKALLTNHAPPPPGSEAESELELSRIGVREEYSENVCIFLATEGFHDT